MANAVKGIVVVDDLVVAVYGSLFAKYQWPALPLKLGHATTHVSFFAVFEKS